MWEYLNRQQKHLHSGHSCGSSTPCGHSAARMPHFRCTSCCPARCHPSLARSRHFPELQWPCHTPAACTQPGRQRGPRSHHKLSPTVPGSRSQRDLHTGAFRSPDGCRELWERGHGHKTVREVDWREYLFCFLPLLSLEGVAQLSTKCL